MTKWLRSALTEPAGFQYRRVRADDEALRARLGDFCAELGVLEYQVQQALERQGNAWSVMSSIVQTVERVRATYYQAAIAAEAKVTRRTVPGVGNGGDITSSAWKTTGEELLAGTARLCTDVEAMLQQPDLPASMRAMHSRSTLDKMLDDFLEYLRSIGVVIGLSQAVPD